MCSLPLLFLAVAAASALTLPQAARSDNRNRALYFLDNNPAGSSIISLKISNDDGTLSDPVRTSTGGFGAFGENAGAPAGPDSLFGADAVAVDNDYLFTVNAGSNTVSMFKIDKDDPWHPTLVGTPVSSGGDFPMAVAYSSKLKTACVLNGGATAGILCFSADHAKGLTPLDASLRSLAIGQTTPPHGPPSTTSDILFNPSETALFVTVKGVPGSVSGSLYVYPVVGGKVSTTPVVTRIADITLDFSATFLGGDSELLITDPSFGGSILRIDGGFEATEKSHIAVQNQAAICWSAYSERAGNAFLLDAGRGNITVVNPGTGAIRGYIGVTAPGMLDAVVDRRWMYVLSGDAAVVVVGLEEGIGKQVQKADLSAVGPRKGWMGVAVYPK